MIYKENKLIYALHGFLGHARDWQTLLAKTEFDEDLMAFDLLTADTACSYSRWTNEFNAKISAETSKERILMGYSLGGRLALHSLISQPKLWQAAIIISTHPGIENNDIKIQRQQQDNEWAARFEEEDWTHLMQDWEKRSVFKDDFRFVRHEKDYNRKLLGDILRNLSVAKQENLISQLALIDIPILWMVGENDSSYVEHAKRVSLKHPLSKKYIRPNASHRLPWQNPKLFIHEISTFITQIKERQLC